MHSTAGEVKLNTYRLLLMDTPVLSDQLRHHLCSDTKLIYQERWIIGTDGERESGNSMLSVKNDDEEVKLCASR